jgi:hypothetical protein
LLKIARPAGDERGDPATRALAMAKLEEIHAANPELFAVEKAAPIDDPLWWYNLDPRDDSNGNPERDFFLDPQFWRQSAKGNSWRKYRGLTITIFLDAGRGDGDPSKWCASDPNPTFSRRRYATEGEAMSACWADHVAPRFGLA